MDPRRRLEVVRRRRTTYNVPALPTRWRGRPRVRGSHAEPRGLARDARPRDIERGEYVGFVRRRSPLRSPRRGAGSTPRGEARRVAVQQVRAGHGGRPPPGPTGSAVRRPPPPPGGVASWPRQICCGLCPPVGKMFRSGFSETRRALRRGAPAAGSHWPPCSPRKGPARESRSTSAHTPTDVRDGCEGRLSGVCAVRAGLRRISSRPDVPRERSRLWRRDCGRAVADEARARPERKLSRGVSDAYRANRKATAVGLRQRIATRGDTARTGARARPWRSAGLRRAPSGLAGGSAGTDADAARRAGTVHSGAGRSARRTSRCRAYWYAGIVKPARDLRRAGELLPALVASGCQRRRG